VPRRVLGSRPPRISLEDRIHGRHQQPDEGSQASAASEAEARQAPVAAQEATTSEKLVMAEKIRKLTPGCDGLIARMGLEDRKR
jgi:hypothetical protein